MNKAIESHLYKAVQLPGICPVDDLCCSMEPSFSPLWRMHYSENSISRIHNAITRELNDYCCWDASRSQLSKSSNACWGWENTLSWYLLGLGRRRKSTMASLCQICSLYFDIHVYLSSKFNALIIIRSSHADIYSYDYDRVVSTVFTLRYYMI